MTAFNSAPSASTPKATNRASIQVVTPPSEPVARRLTRTPSISVPNLDRTQFGKDSELVLLIDQLKADLARSQQEVRRRLLHIQDDVLGVPHSTEKVAVEHSTRPTLRLVELESAMHDAKRAEVRALELVVATIGKVGPH
ncbi:hypothetical protein DYB28_007303 [Aphanomyces astaci]|uniref:Uncharacterized protein n=1 Tax=Aphanomyces astaci TaxID=112090 RepID=A0A397CUL0_APHAT|nr:hypothetical protein DYB36_000026 [Aphanomyces astaci]RHY19113.1 hypothetical protein DYB25_000054 [Aphanomyces astaci]RHY43558.1 hypothetical protein DYB30_000276 [Aphanomyces astaci]RHY53246.1 hypothetical protein DYB38_000135 [Aphanomyces astaci]RHY68962.1 hypothetical protein DYB34_000406 [Aphanomyces astaci]